MFCNEGEIFLDILSYCPSIKDEYLLFPLPFTHEPAASYSFTHDMTSS